MLLLLGLLMFPSVQRTRAAATNIYQVHFRKEKHAYIHDCTTSTFRKRYQVHKLQERGSHVSVSPKARSSISSSSSLASGKSSKTSPETITWHVEHAHTPSQAPWNPAVSGESNEKNMKKTHIYQRTRGSIWKRIPGREEMYGKKRATLQMEGGKQRNK